jgi:hypothetical protein
MVLYSCIRLHGFCLVKYKDNVIFTGAWNGRNVTAGTSLEIIAFLKQIWFHNPRCPLNKLDQVVFVTVRLLGEEVLVGVVQEWIKLWMVNCKVTPVLKYAPRHEDIWGGGGCKSARILNLNTRRSRASASRPGRFTPVGRSLVYPLKSRLGGLQIGSGGCGEEKKMFFACVSYRTTSPRS